MTRQRTDVQVLRDALKREAVKASLSRLVRRGCRTKRARAEAIARASQSRSLGRGDMGKGS